jgi:hypothetical protein
MTVIGAMSSLREPAAEIVLPDERREKQTPTEV